MKLIFSLSASPLILVAPPDQPASCQLRSITSPPSADAQQDRREVIIITLRSMSTEGFN